MGATLAIDWITLPIQGVLDIRHDQALPFIFNGSSPP
jgi:hypothetical protein